MANWNDPYAGQGVVELENPSYLPYDEREALYRHNYEAIGQEAPVPTGGWGSLYMTSGGSDSSPISLPSGAGSQGTRDMPGTSTAFKDIAGGASFNPFDPEAYIRGWGKTIQGKGLDPYANTPFMNYLGSLAQPISSNYLLNAIAGNSGIDPAGLVSGLQGAMGNPNMGMLSAGSSLNALRDLVMQFYNNELDPSKHGMLAGLVGGWEANPNSMLQALAMAMGGGLSGAGQGIMTYLNRLRGQHSLMDTDQPWVRYFFENQMGR